MGADGGKLREKRGDEWVSGPLSLRECKMRSEGAKEKKRKKSKSRGRTRGGVESGIVCVAARERGTRGIARGTQHKMTKEAKKKKLKEKMEMRWADNLSAQVPPWDQCIRRWRQFYTPTSTCITPSSNLGIVPPRSHPVLAIFGISVRSCAPLGPLTQP